MNQITFSFPHVINRYTKKTNLSTESRSINECLGILLRTRPGELLGDPSYGCNLIDRVYRYNGVIIEKLIREDIALAVTKYEPRVIINEDDITIVRDGHVLRIFLLYTIKETGELNEYNMELTDDNNPYKIT